MQEVTIGSALGITFGSLLEGTKWNNYIYENKLIMFGIIVLFF